MPPKCQFSETLIARLSHGRSEGGMKCAAMTLMYSDVEPCKVSEIFEIMIRTAPDHRYRCFFNDDAFYAAVLTCS